MWRMCLCVCALLEPLALLRLNVYAVAALLCMSRVTVILRLVGIEYCITVYAICHARPSVRRGLSRKATPPQQRRRQPSP